MKPYSQWTKDEKSILLYLETCLVDNYGFAKGLFMNEIDIEISKKWDEEGFIVFKRIPFDYLEKAGQRNTHYVRFTPEAWIIAHDLRIKKAERILAKHPVDKIESYRRIR